MVAVSPSTLYLSISARPGLYDQASNIHMRLNLNEKTAPWRLIPEKLAGSLAQSWLTYAFFYFGTRRIGSGSEGLRQVQSWRLGLENSGLGCWA